MVIRSQRLSATRANIVMEKGTAKATTALRPVLAMPAPGKTISNTGKASSRSQMAMFLKENLIQVTGLTIQMASWRMQITLVSIKDPYLQVTGLVRESWRLKMATSGKVSMTTTTSKMESTHWPSPMAPKSRSCSITERSSAICNAIEQVSKGMGGHLRALCQREKEIKNKLRLQWHFKIFIKACFTPL